MPEVFIRAVNQSPQLNYQVVPGREVECTRRENTLNRFSRYEDPLVAETFWAEPVSACFCR
jgi:hypothetical protein